MGIQMDEMAVAIVVGIVILLARQTKELFEPDDRIAGAVSPIFMVAQSGKERRILEKIARRDKELMTPEIIIAAGQHHVADADSKIRFVLNHPVDVFFELRGVGVTVSPNDKTKRRGFAHGRVKSILGTGQLAGDRPIMILCLRLQIGKLYFVNPYFFCGMHRHVLFSYFAIIYSGIAGTVGFPHDRHTALGDVLQIRPLNLYGVIIGCFFDGCQNTFGVTEQFVTSLQVSGGRPF